MCVCVCVCVCVCGVCVCVCVCVLNEHIKRESDVISYFLYFHVFHILFRQIFSPKDNFRYFCPILLITKLQLKQKK